MLSRARTRLAVCVLTAGLTACGGGSEDESAPQTDPQPVAPQVTLSASNTSVPSGSSVTLTWSSGNATTCTASGAWSGSRVLSGSESSGPLSADSTFTLSCTGAGGTTQRQVIVTVSSSSPGPSQPAVNISASPAAVSVNGTTTLSWSSSNVGQCTASGAWSGPRATSGQQIVGPLIAAATFALSCSGGSGTAQNSVTVNVASDVAGTVRGAVDSSLVDVAGVPAIYVFLGNVQPDDRDGDDGDPLTVVEVVQDANACTFQYATTGLAPGTYTLAYTAESQRDRPGLPDTITFQRTATFTVGASAVVQNFGATRILRVGADKPHSSIAAASAAAQSGDVIEVDAGTYPDDVVVWRTNGLVVRGVGGRAHVQGTRTIGFSSGNDRQNGKGLWVVRGTGMRVENIEFSNARVTDQNGAGIRNEGRNLTICNSVFRDSENGFLGEAYGTLTIEYSTFRNNGIVRDGFTHNVYVGSGGTSDEKLVFRHNDSHHAYIGHTLKTRAPVNYILYNRLADESDGTSSYNIDVPNGGLTFVIGNLIQQSPFTDNSVLIAYGAEGLGAGRTHSLYLVNNTIVNDRGGGTFVSVNGGMGELRSINNLFVGDGTRFSGKQPASTADLATNSPAFVDRAAFDYRLTTGSPAVDAGSSPGSAAGQSLQPLYQYIVGGRREVRPSVDTIDVGALELMR